MELIAHRGIHGHGFSENSEQAIKAVLVSVADGVETDIRLTKDDVCIVYHDSKTKLLNDVVDTTYSQIAEVEADVMRVEHLLDILQDYTGLVNIEIKHIFGEKGSKLGPECISKLKTALESFKIENILISSFSIRNIRTAKEELPDIRRAYLVPAFMPTCLALLVARKLECSAIHFANVQTKRPFIKFFISRAHKHGLKVRVHTINDSNELERLSNLGVDGVFTDEVVALAK